MGIVILLHPIYGVFLGLRITSLWWFGLRCPGPLLCLLVVLRPQPLQVPQHPLFHLVIRGRSFEKAFRSPQFVRRPDLITWPEPAMFSRQAFQGTYLEVLV